MAGQEKASSAMQPYMLRALYEWCSDNGFTPHIAVKVDESVRVPQEYVRDGRIVLNIAAHATHALTMGNEHIEFQARFGGVPRSIFIPVDRVLAIYAAENGQGMAFSEVESGTSEDAIHSQNGERTLDSTADPSASTDEGALQEEGKSPVPPNGGGRKSSMRLVK